MVSSIQTNSLFLDFGVYVDKYGRKIASKEVIYWSGTPFIFGNYAVLLSLFYMTST